MRLVKDHYRMLSCFVALSVILIAGCATQSRTESTKALPTGLAMSEVPAAIAAARAGMSETDAWTIIEERLKAFCEPDKNDLATPPVTHRRTCTKIERSGFAYSETATLMKAEDFRNAVPKGQFLFGASDRNGLVMVTKTARVLSRDPIYQSNNGPIRLGVWEGTGKSVDKPADTVTWGPRNVKVDFADPAIVLLSRSGSRSWDCDVYKDMPAGTTTVARELIIPLYMNEGEMPTFMAALATIWPNAKLSLVESGPAKQ